MFKDLDIFVAAAQAIWMGQDPYKLNGVEVFYPLPFYFLFLPFAWLPPMVVHGVWSVLNGIVLVAVLRRRALPTVLSAQALLTFLLGQVDIVMMGLYVLVQSGASGGGIALAFMMLKPQLAFLLAPFMVWRWWKTQRRELVWFLAVGALLTMSSFIAQPNWVFSLLNRSGERVRANISASLWGLLSFLPSPLWIGSVVVMGLVLVIWAWRTDRIRIVETAGLLLSPFIFAYNLMPLYAMFRSQRVLLTMAAVSWLAFVIADLQSNDRASALVAVLALVILFREWRRAQKGRDTRKGRESV